MQMKNNNRIVSVKQLAHEFNAKPIAIRYILRAKYKPAGEKARWTWQWPQDEATEVRRYIATVLGRRPS